MITEETVVVRYQTPNAPNEWLYQDTTDEGKPVRKFYRDMYLGKNQDPLPECTDEEKVQWEEEHKPQPEPEPSPEPSPEPEQEGGEV